MPPLLRAPGHDSSSSFVVRTDDSASCVLVSTLSLASALPSISRAATLRPRLRFPCPALHVLHEPRLGARIDSIGREMMGGGSNVYARHKCASPGEHSVVVVMTTRTLYKPLTTGAEPVVVSIENFHIRSFLLTRNVKKAY
jgi:hypothetical protein